MSRREELLRVMKICLTADQRSAGDDSRLLMARLAELAGIVARAAGHFLPICGHRMSREEIAGMILPAARGVRPMTIETLLAGMAPGTGLSG
jgi:hypothetical protein